MGYSTDFFGTIKIEPALNEQEAAFLQKLSDTRRMNRRNGPYFIDGTGMLGQGHDADIINYNAPDPTQPGLWCQWVPSHDGAGLVWNGCEKFYSATEWMCYIIEHFLKPGAIAKSKLPFLQANHVCNGVIRAEGEDPSDRWRLVVRDNVVATVDEDHWHAVKSEVEAHMNKKPALLEA